MDASYTTLKLKLEELGYNQSLPQNAVPLVECMLADLLQTTRSLQHYMELSKEALSQRDALMLEAEPYRQENARLVQENNQMYRQIMEITEENMKITKDSRRKIKNLTDLISRKEMLISKLQHELRELSMRGLCAETYSSRLKRKDQELRQFVTIDKYEKDTELYKQVQELERKTKEYIDEIALLKSQVDHRDSEIIRLNIMLEGGRPLSAITRDCCKENKYQSLIQQIQELQKCNEALQKELENGLDKQHEAMFRALKLADKNAALQEEIKKVDAMALKVEEDYNKKFAEFEKECNKKLAELRNELNCTQTQLNKLTLRNSELETELASAKVYTPTISKIQELLNITVNEKETLQKEIKELTELNKSLVEKVVSKNLEKSECKDAGVPTKKDLEGLLEFERRQYEKHIKDVQEKLSETISIFNARMQGLNKNIGSKSSNTHINSTFVHDLQKKMCESEQKILMLLKENEELKNKLVVEKEKSKQNFMDIINQLNAENTELSKENIALSKELSSYKISNHVKAENERASREIKKLKSEIEQLTCDIQILRKDKNEYNLRLKEANEAVDKLKRDLAYKHKEIESLQEENNSYKMSTRNRKASSELYKDECNFLREQIKLLQTDIIKEKTLSNQVKNIQLETERSYNETQNELHCVQKKLSAANNTIEQLDKKCKDLQNEIMTLQNDKSNLMDVIKSVDQERDKLVIELDKKTENECILEQKVKSQILEINKLENEKSELMSKLNVNKLSEHKLVDFENQKSFLNNEISRLHQQLDSAIMENKQLQSSLADANGRLKLRNIEYENSRKEVDSLKQQLQHYVEEVRRIEDLLSQKEAERSDMLEQFASLSVEANMLENTNFSLETESASKSVQLHSYISHIKSLESKVAEKAHIIEKQSACIATLNSKVTALENEVKLITEEKIILEQNVICLKKMCDSLQNERTCNAKCAGDNAAEIKLYENKIKNLTSTKAKLEADRDKVHEKLVSTEKLLSNARREIVELKLALQDATDETKTLQGCVSRLSRRDTEAVLTQQNFQLPLTLEDSTNESHDDEDDENSEFNNSRRRYSKYSTHGSTI